MELLDQVYLGNSVRAYLTAAGAVLAVLLVVKVVVHVLVKRLSLLAQRTKTSVDDTVIRILGATRFLLATIVALHLGAQLLTLRADVATWLRLAAVLAFLLQVGLWLSASVTATAVRMREKKMTRGDTAGLGVITMMGLFGRIVVWVVVVLLALDNLGVNITAAVAGLGIGGIAVALAAQNILGDIFASVSIMLDQPFVIGDTIHVGDLVGTVEHIGVKTTRLRSVNGEQLVFSNGDLLGSRIRNYQRMAERRVVLALGVTYQTPIATLERLPALVKEIIEREPQTRFDRAHLKSFGASSLDYEVVYWIKTPDYGVFMDTQQRVDLEVLRAFERLGVDFAYPTQTHFSATTAPRAAAQG
ncbi:MAG TPA: mechanosensitive ion channel family protein [Kofleriaceae bacterium]|nr:mechanosensitive ion channel family protein [Kofleriaceae bacterium]